MNQLQRLGNHWSGRDYARFRGPHIENREPGDSPAFATSARYTTVQSVQSASNKGETVTDSSRGDFAMTNGMARLSATLCRPEDLLPRRRSRNHRGRFTEGRGVNDRCQQGQIAKRAKDG